MWKAIERSHGSGALLPPPWCDDLARAALALGFALSFFPFFFLFPFSFFFLSLLEKKITPFSLPFFKRTRMPKTRTKAFPSANSYATAQLFPWMLSMFNIRTGGDSLTQELTANRRGYEFPPSRQWNNSRTPTAHTNFPGEDDPRPLSSAEAAHPRLSPAAPPSAAFSGAKAPRGAPRQPVLVHTSWARSPDPPPPFPLRSLPALTAGAGSVRGAEEGAGPGVPRGDRKSVV